VSSKGFLFPGQGAQTVGMGQDLVESSAAAREVFESAERETGLPLSQLCFEGPVVELSRSDIAQPAILTVSIAALRAMEQAASHALCPGAAAGLSLGEYSALVAAGAMDLHTAVRLVQRRGLYMQDACQASPGTMYSVIGLEDTQVEQACQAARERTGGGVWAANYNCPGQVVISGEEGPARAAANLCTRAGARKVMQLNVAGAFHTPLMQPAADKLARDLAGVEMRKPNCPVLANVTGRPVSQPEDIRRLLPLQVTSPVRWFDCMKWMLAHGVTECYEIGPGRVLQGLLKRTDPSCACVTVNGAADVRAWAAKAAGTQQNERGQQ